MDLIDLAANYDRVGGQATGLHLLLRHSETVDALFTPLFVAIPIEVVK